MLWANFLHFYQPHNQQFDILERIVNESYRKIIAGLASAPGAKITVNINGGLTEMLVKYGYKDVIDGLKDLAEKGQIEFTGSAKYHPFLPLLSEEEIARQIQLNQKTNKKYFGKVYNPQGFFSPELAYNKKVAKAAKKLGFKWILAEELANPQKCDFKKIYSIKGLNGFKVIFRDKKISVLILSAVVRNLRSLFEELKDELEKDRYLLTVMDAETFGHHRPGLENLLFSILKSKKFKKATVSELVKRFEVKETVEPRDSTWSSEEQDFWLEKEKKHSFTLWHHPENLIHKLQWEFTDFIVNLVKKLDRSKPWYQEVREKLDKALQSDQYWWASARPWWSLEMIEQGAFALRDVVASCPTVSDKLREKAERYYRQIIDLAFQWQREGAIRQAYRQALKTVKQRPYKKRVLTGQFNSIILEFEDEMNKAIKAQEFEKAIKWRDAIYKLKGGMDIYDVLHVVDDLRISRHLPSLKDYWEHAPSEFSSFAKKHFVGFEEKKFIKVQPKQLFDEIKAAFKKKKMGHPLGFFRDEYDNFHLCELPSQYIEHWPGEGGWDAMSLAKFPKNGKYSRQGQCLYQFQRGKLTITIKSQSIIAKFLRLLRANDAYKGKFLRVAVLAETNRWAPVFFRKVKNGRLKVTIPYKYSKEGEGFKFKITGYTLKK